MELSTVPKRMHLSEVVKLNIELLHSAMLMPISTVPSPEKGNGSFELGDELSQLKDVAAKQSGSVGSIAFVVRRPG
jgi:hypothetical protein